MRVAAAFSAPALADSGVRLDPTFFPLFQGTISPLANFALRVSDTFFLVSSLGFHPLAILVSAAFLFIAFQSLLIQASLVLRISSIVFLYSGSCHFSLAQTDLAFLSSSLQAAAPLSDIRLRTSSV